MNENSRQRKAALLVLLALAGILAVTMWYQVRKPSTADTTNPTEQGLAATSPPTSPPIVGSSVEFDQYEPLATRASSPVSEDHHHSEKPVSAQDLRAQTIDALNEQDRKFQSEPRSHSWSSSTERVIEAAFSDANLTANEAPKPIAHDAECRTSTCRIRVTYASEMDATMGEFFLLGDIARELPSAKMARLGAPDGSVEVVVYAETGQTTH